MMSFIETQQMACRSLLLYGNLNDSVIAQDLVLRSMDFYLNALLKSLGYKYVVFYGSDGNKGAYCLDPVSARFFFGEGCPLPKGTKTPRNNKSSDGRRASIRDQLNARRGGYRPGQTPGREPEADASDGRQEKTGEKSTQRYAQRTWQLPEFFRTMRTAMNTSNAPIAVVFYDIFSTPLGQLPDLVDYINRQIDHTEHLILLMGPSTLTNHSLLIQHLAANGISDRFTVLKGSGVELNPNNTFCVDMPHADEIALLLHRLTLLGTPRGRRIRLPADERLDVAKEIYRCIRLGDRLPANCALRPIEHTLNSAIDSQPGNGDVALNKAFVRGVWRVEGEDDTPILEKLNRPGWEAVYEAMQRVAAQARLDFAGKTAREETKGPWFLERTAYDRFEQKETRPRVPCFILTGSSGVGRKTVARQIGKFLYELGYLRAGHTLTASRDQLTSPYVNGTPRETRARFDEADEGVLLIPDADTLTAQDGGANHEPGGAQVVRTLTTCLQESNRHVCVVLTGTKEGVERLSRFSDAFLPLFQRIHIEDFKPNLLLGILLEAIQGFGHEVDPALTACSPDGNSPLGHMVQRLYRERNRASFANASEMIRLARQACSRVAEGGKIGMEDFCALGMTQAWFEPDDVDGDFAEALEAFRKRFVGMDAVCDKLLRTYRLIQERIETGRSPESLELPSMILCGNPGVGKTAVANLLARMYFSLGMLGSAKPIVVNASSLASAYAGGAQERMLDAVKQAQDVRGLLLIDEAHQMAEPGAQGALRALMSPMTDANRPFMCVLTCYQKRLSALQEIDDGMKRRFRDVITLEDYTGEQLHEIFLRMKDARCSLSQEADDLLGRLCEYLYLTRTDSSGNAGQMQNLLAEMEHNRAARCYEERIPIDSPARWIYSPKDFPARLVEKLPPRDEEPEKVLEEILRELDERYEGLDEIKAELRRLTDRAIDAKRNGQALIQLPIRPIVFCGNPGTGKTMVAGLMAGLLYRLHMIASPDPISASAPSLMGMYQNETRRLTAAAIEQARSENRLMIVDECAGVCDPHNAAAREFAGSFLAPLTDSQRALRVVFAVYPENLDDFLSLDNGLSSRVRVFQLPDYDGQQLFHILCKRVAQDGLTLTDEAKDILRVHCEHLYAMRTNRTGNARQIETLLERMRDARLARLRHSGIEDVAAPEYGRYAAEDIPEEIRRGISAASKEREIDRLNALREQLETEIVGYNGVREMLKEKLEALVFNQKYPSMRSALEPGHYAFLGNPGTGKTTGAALLARYLYKMGLLASDELMKTSGIELMAEYEGQSGHNVRRKLEAARGHVLLIDEAYGLLNDGMGNFKQDVLNTLVNYLDDPSLRLSTCVVLAGYQKDMRRLYTQNDGLRSRIREIQFPDFTEEECMQVAKQCLRQKGYTVDDGAVDALKDAIRHAIRCGNFSNGRTVRGLSDLLVRQARSRALNADYNTQDDSLSRILAEDIPQIDRLAEALNLTPPLL